MPSEAALRAARAAIDIIGDGDTILDEIAAEIDEELNAEREAARALKEALAGLLRECERQGLWTVGPDEQPIGSPGFTAHDTTISNAPCQDARQALATAEKAGI